MIQKTIMKARQPFLTDANAPKRLENYLRETIPVAAHMDIRVLSTDVHGVLLEAPLAPNVNHLGTAFGGSLHGLGTLACWGLVWLALEDRRERQVLVSESSMKYLAPANGTFQARCPLPAPEALIALREGYLAKGRSRIHLTANLAANAKEVATFAGSFVVLKG